MKIRLLILSLLVSVPAFAWQPQTGDIIFQISRSSQSKAIQLATHSDYNRARALATAPEVVLPTEPVPASVDALRLNLVT